MFSEINFVKVTVLSIIAGIFLTVLPLMAQRGDDADRVSKNGKAEGTIDSVEVVVEYGRPKVNDRQIWGGLVPYNKVWRTGANEATTISFSRDVLVNGKELPAGKYAIFTIPGEEKWTIVFNKEAQQWGAFNYDEDKDVLRIEAKPEKNKQVEEMTYTIDGSEVVMKWAGLKVPFTVAAAE
ncbi:MAG: DUF2911 domain-containing protein [Calditrichia bacterium]